MSNHELDFLFLLQLTSTMLHVLSLASATDHQPLKDFLVKVSINQPYLMFTNAMNEFNEPLYAIMSVM